MAFRNGYMNFYSDGKSLAKVNFGSDGKLQAKVHWKYVPGCTGARDYVTWDSNGFSEVGTEQPFPYISLKELTTTRYGGHEKRFVDLIVAHNPNVIDLEMGLPAYSKDPGKNRAPRMDLVALEPKDGLWQIVFWEAKLVDDERARCQRSGTPAVIAQLKDYTDWLNDDVRRNSVVEAYQKQCKLLVALHKMARRGSLPVQDLGPGIQAVGAEGAPLPGIDCKPRLVIDNCRKDILFEEPGGHMDKLKDAGWQVRMVKKVKDLPFPASA